MEKTRRSAAVPAGSSAASGSNRRLQQTQNQVDEVVDIMRVNVDKVLERDQKLSELDDRADALQAGASQFETSAAKLKRKYWWKNCKMWAIGISVVVIIIIIIIGEFSSFKLFGACVFTVVFRYKRGHQPPGLGPVPVPGLLGTGPHRRR
ncbi:Vesicle-associated membrane protein 3 [Pteropus alecto]|uniref:Vesicle-associated membrane protein 3 n=1 Tax=Pteropus alecto TaxID=9402 RepID=L5KFU6_PTEAL|nr:Vesicle-associated membrane protein 3 [Pteropus alecto]